MRRWFLLAVFGAALGAAAPSWASDLGTAGGFRSVGGGQCPAGSPNSCAPPPVDPALPVGQQVRAHVARALALIDLLRMGDSKAALDDALTLDPNDLQALTLRGRMALSNGDVGHATIDIDHALALSPNDPDLLATRGAVTFSRCACGQGLDDLNTALKLQPNDIDALFLRAQFFLTHHAPAAAFNDLSVSLGLDPQDMRARAVRAGAEIMLKNYDLATLDADKVIAAQPWNTEAYRTRAIARLSAGDEIGALASYTMMLDGVGQGAKSLMVPTFRNAMIERAKLYLKMKRFDDAGRDLAAIIAQGGQKAILRLQLYLHGNGYPNIEISGTRSAPFDIALGACFADTVCGPNILK